MSWKTSGACHDPDFPVEWWGGETPADRRSAQAVCWEMCPVREKCLADALSRGEPWGIWGGYTVTQRQRIAKGCDPGPIGGMPRRPSPQATVECACGRKCKPHQLVDGRCWLCVASDERATRAEERMHEFLRLARKGMTRAEIAARMGVTESALANFAKRARERGFTVPKSQSTIRRKRIQRAKQLASSGVNTSLIAADLGVGRQRVQEYLKEAA